MTKLPLLAGSLAGLLLAAAATAQETAQPEGSDPAGTTTIATVNGESFPLDLFRLFYLERRTKSQAQDTPAFQSQAFNEFINLVVTAQDAERRNFHEQPNVKHAIELRRMELLSRLALQEAVRRYEPSEEELQKLYDERFGTANRTEYKARHILVKTEEEAEEIIAQLDQGADFAELAKTESLGPTGKNGGDLGWFDASQMVKPFTDAVSAMEPGKHSDTPVQTQFGWHVILLEETRQSDPPSLESVKDQLISTLQREKLADYVTQLRSGADLELNTDLIKASPGGGDAAPAD